MADLISRAAALEAAIDGADDWDGGYSPSREEYIRSHMDRVPAVDAVPVVHGRWVERMYKTGDITSISYFCSKCDSEHYFGMANYCPHCGAKMDGERREHEQET